MTFDFLVNVIPVVRPLLQPSSPRPESPSTPVKKLKGKTVTKAKKGKEGRKEDIKGSEEAEIIMDNIDGDKIKKNKLHESKIRPESPQTGKMKNI